MTKNHKNPVRRTVKVALALSAALAVGDGAAAHIHPDGPQGQTIQAGNGEDWNNTLSDDPLTV
jgi:ferric-dicitrate binding protein FerR (iron transport regulator)